MVGWLGLGARRMGWVGLGDARRIVRTFPTAASPRRTSFTLLLGLGALGAGESDIAGFVLWIDCDGCRCGPRASRGGSFD